MDQELKSKLSNFALTVSAEDKALRTLLNGNRLTLSLLNTREKSNLVAAINEILGTVESGGVSLETVEEVVSDYFVLHPQTFVYEQLTPVYSMLITHPLDHLPAVTFTDSAGTQWSGQVSYPARNQVLVQFNLPLAGKAVLT